MDGRSKYKNAEEPSAGDKSKAGLADDAKRETRDQLASYLSAMDATVDLPEQSFPDSGEKMKKVYVAVGAGSNSKAMVLWALHKLPKDPAAALVLLHVYPTPKLIPISTCVSP